MTDGAGPRGKSFSDEQNERMRAAARQLLDKFPSVTALADRLDIAQPTLSNFINGRTGAGPELATKLAKALGVSFGEFVDGVAASVPAPTEHPIWGNAEGWAESAIVATKRWKHITPEVLTAVSQTSSLFLDAPITPELILQHANAWLASLSEERLERIDSERVRAEIAAAEARYNQALTLQKEMLARGEQPPPVHELMRKLAAVGRRAARQSRRAKANDAPEVAPKSGGTPKKKARPR